MDLGNGLGDRKAEASARPAGGDLRMRLVHETVEDRCPNGFGDPGALVVYTQQELMVVAIDRDAYRAARRCVLDGIVQQVDEQTTQKGWRRRSSWPWS